MFEFIRPHTQIKDNNLSNMPKKSFLNILQVFERTMLIP